MTTEKYAVGTLATLMGTELNSLASSSGLTAGAISGSAYNNTQGGGGGDGYTRGEMELLVNWTSGTPAAGGAAYVWFVKAPDGTDYEYGGAAAIPARPPDVVIPFPNAAMASGYRVSLHGIEAPPGNWYALLSQNSGLAFPASGNTLKWLPYTRQGV